MGHRDAMAGTLVTESARVSELVLLSECGQDTVTLCFLVPQLIEWGQNAYLFPEVGTIKKDSEIPRIL